MSIEQLESKILSGDGLNSLTDNELYQVAKHFVGDAPPSHIPRETVIGILSEQESVKNWQNDVKSKAAQIAAETVQNVQSKIAENSDNPMVVKIKESFGKWLQDSGYNVQELTVKLDVNSDGIISIEEISNFIVELTGNQPPAWVLTHISAILDKNMDGEILVSELWQYLEELGFQMPVIEEPVIEEPVVEESIAEEEDNLDEFEEEFDNDSIEIEVKEVPEIESTQPELSIEETQERSLIEEPSVSTNIEKTIEILEKSRLHSEANEIIANSNSGYCTLKVERVERNLMVSDTYRGGKTLTGILDNGPFSIAVLFEPEFNDFIDQNISKNKVVSFEASLFEWSSGLRKAKLKGKSLELKD